MTPIPNSTEPTPETPYTVFCGWCGAETGRYSSIPHSHGLCAACAKKLEDTKPSER